MAAGVCQSGQLLRQGGTVGVSAGSRSLVWKQQVGGGGGLAVSKLATVPQNILRHSSDEWTALTNYQLWPAAGHDCWGSLLIPKSKQVALLKRTHHPTLCNTFIHSLKQAKKPERQNRLRGKHGKWIIWSNETEEECRQSRTSRDELIPKLPHPRVMLRKRLRAEL